jgi:hypothetical protein
MNKQIREQMRQVQSLRKEIADQYSDAKVLYDKLKPILGDIRALKRKEALLKYSLGKLKARDCKAVKITTSLWSKRYHCTLKDLRTLSFPILAKHCMNCTFDDNEVVTRILAKKISGVERSFR